MKPTIKNILERTVFYKEIAHSGIEYAPTPQYFEDVEVAIKDLSNQIKELQKPPIKKT